MLLAAIIRHWLVTPARTGEEYLAVREIERAVQDRIGVAIDTLTVFPGTGTVAILEHQHSRQIVGIVRPRRPPP